MKNIYAFPALVIIFFMFLFPLAAQTETGKNVLSISPLGGILWGQGTEIVYHEEPPRNNSAYLSELLWDYKPLFFLGLELDYSPKFPWLFNGLYSSLSIKIGLPFKTGYLEDRDWLANNKDYLTHFSTHDAYSDSTFSACLTLGYSLALFDHFWLRPYLEFSFMRFSWKSKDGYWQYGTYTGDLYTEDYDPWNPDIAKKIHSGPAIDYYQNWRTYSRGIAFGFGLANRFSIMAFASWTPIIYADCRDDHLGESKTNTYIDLLEGGSYTKLGAVMEFYISRRIALTYSFEFMKLKGAKGDDYLSISGSSFFLTGNRAGGGFSFSGITLSARFFLEK